MTPDTHEPFLGTSSVGNASQTPYCQPVWCMVRASIAILASKRWDVISPSPQQLAMRADVALAFFRRPPPSMMINHGIRSCGRVGSSALPFWNGQGPWLKTAQLTGEDFALSISKFAVSYTRGWKMPSVRETERRGRGPCNDFSSFVFYFYSYFTLVLKRSVPKKKT